MKRRLVSLIGLLMCFAIVGSAFAAHQDKMMSDPLSGKWSGDWGPSANDRNQIAAEFKFDGKALTGSFTPAGQTTAIPIQKGTFDAKTGAVHMEADVKPANGDTVHYVIDGKVDKNVMKGSWNHDKRKGDFNIAKK